MKDEAGGEQVKGDVAAQGATMKEEWQGMKRQPVPSSLIPYPSSLS